jgi:hypothetical protein
MSYQVIDFFIVSIHPGEVCVDSLGSLMRFPLIRIELSFFPISFVAGNRRKENSLHEETSQLLDDEFNHLIYLTKLQKCLDFVNKREKCFETFMGKKGKVNKIFSIPLEESR